MWYLVAGLYGIALAYYYAAYGNQGYICDSHGCSSSW